LRVFILTDRQQTNRGFFVAVNPMHNALIKPRFSIIEPAKAFQGRATVGAKPQRGVGLPTIIAVRSCYEMVIALGESAIKVSIGDFLIH
jgi:hypothetical protein